MRVLVACEFSGTVRDAFIEAGHDGTSCDLLPTERPGPHIVGDVREVDLSGYDLLIAHPPCTYLAASGARWWPGRAQEQAAALAFVRWLLAAPVPALALENPIGRISTAIRPPDQIIHPWMFGHEESKSTCLWLRGVPPLMASVVCERREQRLWRLGPSPDRWRLRSKTYPGIARAMAAQWGGVLHCNEKEGSQLLTNKEM